MHDSGHVTNLSILPCLIDFYGQKNLYIVTIALRCLIDIDSKGKGKLQSSNTNKITPQ